MNARRATVFATTLLVLAALGVQVARKEAILRDGRLVYLELAPVDPRSLIQGDYMALDYALARELREVLPSEAPRRGTLSVHTDARGVATRAAEGPDAFPIAYLRNDSGVFIGTNAYYFEEGTAEAYATARYGAFRVDAAGQALLVGLADEALRPLPADAPPAW
jgi:uncharacterized membrane-anchored protein